MKTINETVINELIIKNSKFITILSPLNDEEELDLILDEIKKEHKKATHYCYAYLVNEIKRYNDDGEPTGTAASPILNVLEKNNLTNILCVVVRYFGGIKLGAGGLIRAYGKSVAEALKLTNLIDIDNQYFIEFSFSHDDLKNINLILKDIKIVKKEFNDVITYTISIKDNQFNIIDTLESNGVTIIKKTTH